MTLIATQGLLSINSIFPSSGLMTKRVFYMTVEDHSLVTNQRWHEINKTMYLVTYIDIVPSRTCVAA